jgi:hypothetical protein
MSFVTAQPLSTQVAETQSPAITTLARRPQTFIIFIGSLQ